ncbi:CU044_2847 family protein [Paraburkholderia aromaticivorans]|uniref:CU044_2847 family protein n=1 Tax=Paraburkholderia aromaticivorans TaxID=2026199 RepID=UPI00145610C6|nr:CU044_2847 family protein [Paraburkholderia aromaticivorans]
MRSEAVEVTLQSGRNILIEVSVQGEEPVSNASQTFSDFGESLTELAKSISSAIEAIKPDSAEVEFGVEAALESGKLTTFLVKGSGSANVKVTLRWGKS